MTTASSSPADGPRLSGATRYLCAEAYLSHRFTETVLERTLHEHHRAVASSPGVDLASVVEHCLEARRLRTLRDIALAVLATTAVVAWLAAAPRLSALCLLVAWLVVLTEGSVIRYDVLARLNRPDPGDAAPHPRRWTVAVRRDLDRIREVQGGNVTVYSGFSPFVGSGFEDESWSFSINVRKGKELVTGDRRAPREFEVGELYDLLGREFSPLSMPGLRVEDHLYVHGQDVRDRPDILPDMVDHPVSVVPDELVQHYRDVPSQQVRHYLVLRVEDWGGELVLSMFLRLQRISSSLFVEASYFLLPPLSERLHRIDQFRAFPDTKEVLGLVARSTWRVPILLPMSYVNLARSVLAPLNRRLTDRADRRRISSNAAFDYGASRTVREEHTSTNYRRYFQKLDREMYSKTIERRIFEVLSQFLDEHGIDTSAFEERQSMVLNNGVMVTGGSFSADTVAAGARAKASSGTAQKGGRTRNAARSAGLSSKAKG